MPVPTCTLHDVADVTGTVVVVDVLRAFTTAAEALAARPARYELVASVEEAFARRRADPDVVLLGEVDAITVDGFDLGNSPVEMAAADVTGRSLVHRSSAGTQGVVRATAAERILVSSFVVASATAAAVSGDEQVTFCVTGRHSGLDGDEDLAAAELIWAHVRHLRDGAGVPDPTPYLARVARSSAGRRFLDPEQGHLHPADVHAAVALDRHTFAMAVRRTVGTHLLERVDVL